MPIDGLEREEGFIAGNNRDLTGHVLLPDTHEHRRIPAFRRILLVANVLASVPAAFSAACALADLSEGEIVVLEPASWVPGIQGSAAQADWTNQASNVDLLEIRRPSLDAASIDQVAQEYACDLVILGMESQTNELRMMTENVAEETFRRVSCPTLIIGPKATCFPSTDSAAGPISSRLPFTTGIWPRLAWPPELRTCVVARSSAFMCCLPIWERQLTSAT
jgi:hypothetical protein